MKRRTSRLLSILLVFVMALALLPGTAFADGSPFSDVAENAWYYDAVEYVYENGIMSGTGGGNFSPDTELTRAQLCQLLYNMEGLPTAEGSTFIDVTKGAWYYDAVSWAASHDIVGGVGNHQFNPDGSVTREQTAAILYRYCAYKGYDTTNTADISGFSDAGQISSWAETAMKWAVGEGLFHGVGDNSVDPTGNVTRAQVATLMMRLGTGKSDYTDYARAFEMDYVDAALADWPLNRQVTSTEYKTILERMIQALAPDKLSWFRERVTDYDTPLDRGRAVTMSYYAAVCIGVDEKNNRFDLNTVDNNDFWGIDHEAFEKLFPHCFAEKPVSFSNGVDVWDNEFTASFLWNIWHSSPISEYQTVAFDKQAMSMRNSDPFTAEEAVCAVTRLWDSPLIFVPIDDAAAITPDSDTLTSALLELAAGTDITSIDDLPRLTGFILKGNYFNETSVAGTPSDLDMIAQWGFTSARLGIAYEGLFSEDLTSVNLTQMIMLDRLVAAAITNGIHLNIQTSTLPGRTIQPDARGGDFDLFVNPEKQAKVQLIFRVLAERYKDVPGAYLSFTPFSEPGNLDMATGTGAPDTTMSDVARVLDLLVSTIREVDPDRFIIYEPHGCMGGTAAASREAYELMSAKYDNVRISYNYCEETYVFAEMTAEEGANIDFDNHSMFKPEYPVTVYAAKKRIESGSNMTIDGFLPEGTVIEVYLRSMGGNGSFTISSQNGALYQESLKNATFQTGYKLSSLYPFAVSDKKIEITLEQNSGAVILACRDGWVEWSGINVILPDEYAVERWYYQSQYDNELEGEGGNAYFYRKMTSTVMLCPNSDNVGSHITIGQDVSFTSDGIFAESNKDTIAAWCAEVSALSPSCVIRFEDACFSLGTSRESILAYYEDMLSVFDHYNFDWYSNDYEIILRGERVAGVQTVQYGSYPNFNMELLELLQRHQ